MAKAKKSEKKETVAASAIKGLLKEHKPQELQATVVEPLDGAELPIIIKTRVTFSEICDAALDIVERCENAKVSRDVGEPLQDISIYGFISQYVLVNVFTNVDLTKVDANTAREFISHTNVMDLIHGAVDPVDLQDVESIALNTLEQRKNKDQLGKAGEKLLAILDKVDMSFDDTAKMNLAEVLDKFKKVAELDEEKIVEAVLKNGANSTGHNDAASGVREQS